MKSNLFNEWGIPQVKAKPVQNLPQQDLFWEKEIKGMMEQGYPYEIAYAVVSKRKIQDLFEKDVKIDGGR